MINEIESLAVIFTTDIFAVYLKKLMTQLWNDFQAFKKNYWNLKEAYNTCQKETKQIQHQNMLSQSYIK